MIGRSGERRSGISVLTAQNDDNDDNSFHCSFILKFHLMSVSLLIHQNFSNETIIIKGDILISFRFYIALLVSI